MAIWTASNRMNFTIDTYKVPHSRNTIHIQWIKNTKLDNCICEKDLGIIAYCKANMGPYCHRAIKKAD